MAAAIPAPLRSRLLRDISVRAFCVRLDNFGLLILGR
jgi:hypothetical protein